MRKGDSDPSECHDDTVKEDARRRQQWAAWSVYARNAAPRATTRPPSETMLEPAAPVACAGTEDEALAGRDMDGVSMAPVELGMVELTGTMGVTSVGTGATGVALGTMGLGVTVAIC